MRSVGLGFKKQPKKEETKNTKIEQPKKEETKK